MTFSAEMKKTCSQPELLFQELFNLRNLPMAEQISFILVLKLGGTVKRATLYTCFYQWSQCINFDKSNNSKQLYLRSWSNFSFVLFGKKNKTTLTNPCFLTNPCSNLFKSMYQFWKVHVTTLINPCINFEKSMSQPM